MRKRIAAAFVIGTWLVSMALILASRAAHAAPVAQATPPARVSNPSPQPAQNPTTEFTRRFPIHQIEVSGNTSVSSAEIQAVVAPYEGKDLSLDDLKRVAAAITALYRRKGYFLSSAYVPAQDVTGGVARIDVVEGRIGQVTVAGNKHYTSAFIKSFFQPVVEAKVAQNRAFERALLLLNEFVDLHVTAVLKQGSATGTTDVVLHVEDKTPFHISFDYNNYGNRFVGENQAGLGVFAGNLIAQGDDLNVRAVEAFPARSGAPFLQAQYVIPVNHVGTKVGVTYANADTLVGRELSILNIRSKANIYGASVTHPLTRTETASVDVSAAYFNKNFNNSILGIPTSNDHLNDLVLGLNGDATSGTGKNLYNISATQGLGGTPRGDVSASRFGAGAVFTKFNADLARIQKLGSWFAILRAGGQISTDPLLVGEEWSLGGPDTVRGYAQSDFLGDDGYYLSGELRVPFVQNPRFNLQGAAFIDTGGASVKNPLPGQIGSKVETGLGFGVRASFGENTDVRLDLGFPLDQPVTTAKNPRLYAQLTHTF